MLEKTVHNGAHECRTNTLLLSRKTGPILVGVGQSDTTLAGFSALSDSERRLCEGFASESRKASFVAGRVCAKGALGQLMSVSSFAEIDIQTGVLGQPVVFYIPQCGYQVSISHTKGRAIAIAYSESHPMAVDIEQLRASSEHAIVKYITSEEVVLASSLSEPWIYLLMWSARESVSKVLRTGLMASGLVYQINDVRSVSPQIYELLFTHLFQYKVLGFVLDDYVITLCLPKHTVGNWDQVLAVLRQRF